MGLRNRYDSSGNLIGAHYMEFDEIPDDYSIQTVLTGSKFGDWSSVGIMKHLRTIKAGEELQKNKYYATEVLSNMALDYLKSALSLFNGVLNDRDGNTITYYLIPCTFCCKHSLELKLKECLVEKGIDQIEGHSVLAIWNKLDEKDTPHAKDITSFLMEVDQIDSNEMALRYGISKDLSPLKEVYKYDIERLLKNTMFLFNHLGEYVISKYRYSRTN